jgi:hypothetical protein
MEGMPSLSDLRLRIENIDQRLRPIANRPVDITKPGWGVRLMKGPHPLEEAGVLHETELLLEELVTSYLNGGEDTREAIRKAFREYKAFAWAATLPFEPITEENFRRHLVLFSMKDQGTDSRDALLWLQHLCRHASTAGVNTGTALREVASLSSDKENFGMGSTKEMLLKAYDKSRH